MADPTSDVQAIINSLPDGELKSGLQKAMGGAFAQIVAWISGYKYTSGDMKLGEVFINRVMNKATTNWRNTPNEVVPVAWVYFTQLFGIRIAVNTDLDAINTTDYVGAVNNYRAGRPESTDIPTNAIQRAVTLINMPGMKPRSQEDPQWGIDKFGLLPYVAPIPDPRTPGAMFTGKLPTGQNVYNGVIGGSPSNTPLDPTTGQPIQSTSGGLGLSTTTIIIIGAALIILIVGVVMITSKKSK